MRRHIWLTDEVVYPPTEQPVKTVAYWIMRDGFNVVTPQPGAVDYLSTINPHPIGSTVERECPFCDGTGRKPHVRKWRERGKLRQRSTSYPCPFASCTDGTQKRRVVSVRLERVGELYPDNIFELENAGFQLAEPAINQYLIVAKTEPEVVE